MKNALISPIEPCQTGCRVAEVSATQFEVGLPLFWVPCADTVVADQYFYDPTTQTILPIPVPAPKAQPAVTGATVI